METVDVLVVGGGQAGLATSYWLGMLTPRLSCRVWEAAASLGSSWVERWDSLRLFTPRRFSSLPGLAFPDGDGECPTRLEMAAYLRRYAAVHDLPVELGRRVTHLTRDGEGFDADGQLRARQVVVATGPFRRPLLPEAATAVQVPQQHSSTYRRPGDLPDVPVTVVGGGDSAAQLAWELCQDRPVTVVAGGHSWHVPSHALGVSTYTWLARTGVLAAPADGWVARTIRRRGEPVFGTTLRDALRSGQVTLLPHRVVGGEARSLLLDDGSRLPVEAVLWCTGFRPDYGWIDVPGAVDDQGEPVHDGGASVVPGLHWVGLPWQRRLDSSIIHGAGPDAKITAARITSVAGAATNSSL